MTTKPKTSEGQKFLEFCDELEDAPARGDPKAVEWAELLRRALAAPNGRRMILETPARLATPKQYNKVRPLEDFDKRNEWGHA